MAIIHKATLSPTKPELLQAWLGHQPWGGEGPLEVLGSYRFDDPAGEVGVEGILARRGGVVLHLPLTYRGAPLEGAEPSLVGTMEHSALGTRWVYDGAGDPVAVGCLVRALQGRQEQADLEIWDGETLVERRESVVRLRVEGAGDGERLVLARVLGEDLQGSPTLVAQWPGGAGVLAALTG